VKKQLSCFRGSLDDFGQILNAMILILPCWRRFSLVSSNEAISWRSLIMMTLLFELMSSKIAVELLSFKAPRC
jgi:hypothetical protein